MTMPAAPNLLATVAATPALAGAAPNGLLLQQSRAALLLARAHSPSRALSELERCAAYPGTIAVVGPPGSGISTLLTQFAAQHQAPLLLCDAASSEAHALLLAQMAAAYQPAPLLVAPASADPSQLERALNAAIASEQKICLVIDGPQRSDCPLILPASLPPQVTLIYGAHSMAQLPYPAREVVSLPRDPAYHAASSLQQALIAANLSLPAQLSLQRMLLIWWQALSPQGRRSALIGACGPLPRSIALALGATENDQLANALLDWDANWLWPRHSLLMRFLELHQAPALANAHAALARAALSNLDRAARRFAPFWAFHALHAPAEQRPALVAELSSERWWRARDRANAASAALADANALFAEATARNDAAALLQHALRQGFYASRARALPVEPTIAALAPSVARHGRETGLRRITEFVDQLADGSSKAELLRRLGDACFAEGMRISAMRLLSRALDLEAQTGAPSHEVDDTFAALASAALPDRQAALRIAALIGRAEQRAQCETQIARAAIAEAALGEAEAIAMQIGHGRSRDWALAEVALAYAPHDLAKAHQLLAEAETETTKAWFYTEHACTLVLADPAAAIAQIATLDQAQQRDRGWVRLSETLCSAHACDDSLAMALRIEEPGLRATTLLALRPQLPSSAGALALNQAEAAVERVSKDDRDPLFVLLIAAYAEHAGREQAINLLARLPEGEAHDRAIARAAVAVASRGEFSAARAMLTPLTDDDERDWALGELANLLAHNREWEAALGIAVAITSEEQRAERLAQLAIIRANQGEIVSALGLARQIRIGEQRTRALVQIAPAAVQHCDAATRTRLAAEAEHLPNSAAQSRYLSALAVALARQGQRGTATALLRSGLRPLDRTRAAVAIGVAASSHDQAAAIHALTIACGPALIGREESLKVVASAAPLIAALGGSPLLSSVAENIALLQHS